MKHSHAEPKSSQKEGQERGISNRGEQQSQNVFVVDLTSRTPPYDRRLCEALDRAGVDVEIWMAGGDRPEQFRRLESHRRWGVVDVSTSLPVTSTTAPFIRAIKAAEYVLNLLILAVAATQERPHTVHLQWLPLLEVFPVETYLISYLKRSGINVVYTAHDVVPLDEQTAPQVYQKVYQAVDKVICHTRRAQTRLVEEFQVAPDRIAVIPHGPLMERDSFPSYESARRTVGWSHNVPTVLIFGVLRPYKGLEFLLQSWARYMHTDNAHGRLVIAGYAKSAYEQQLLNEIRRLDIEHSVLTDFRFLPEGELRTYIAAADVVTYPYRNITQSGALFAGMNAGKAVLVTDVGGLSEVIDDGRNGFVVEYGDTEMFVDRLETLFGDATLRRQFERKAQRSIDKNYSWDAIAQKTVDCYRGLDTTA